ncbi:MAG: hypothetical protein AAF709_13735, partial [Pseudomonadota bacterium]
MERYWNVEMVLTRRKSTCASCLVPIPWLHGQLTILPLQQFLDRSGSPSVRSVSFLTRELIFIWNDH